MEIATDHLRKVLVIDDEVDLCVLLTRKLQSRGFDARYATSIADGVSLFNEFKPNFLILDHNLPDGYGLDHIERFKNQSPEVKVIVISAMTHLGEKALEQGADHFTPKPISFTDIEGFLFSKN